MGQSFCEMSPKTLLCAPRPDSLRALLIRSSEARTAWPGDPHPPPRPVLPRIVEDPKELWIVRAVSPYMYHVRK